MCMWGVVIGLSLCVASCASVLAISFPVMLAIVGVYFVYVDFVRGPIYLLYNCCYK